MATLVKRRKQYVSRIQKWNGIKQISTYIPLRTSKKDTAVVRHHKVEKSENHIKTGIIKKHQFNGYFEWLNDKGESKLTLLTLSEASEQFINAHEVNVSLGSIRRIRISLNNAIKIWKANTPIKHINIDDIESFKAHYKSIHSPCGVNLNLRNIKTFLRWCNDRDMIKSVPKIRMLREPKKLPKYISEDNMNRILNLESVSGFMQRAFYLYLTTGCRRSEVIEGQLQGNMLIVPASLSKSRIERQISLNDVQSEIVKEIHIQRDTHLLKGSQLVTFKDRFTKAFKDACIEVGLDVNGMEDGCLHCLRHTYAVMNWITSNDIYEVKNQLGHTSVKTTEKYAQFNLDRLAQDFPSAYKVRLEVEKVRKNAVKSTLIKSTLKGISESSREDSNSIADC